MTRRDWLAQVLLGGSASRVWGAPLAQAPTADDDPTALSIAALGEAIAAHRWSPLDVTAAYLARIVREDPALGAYVTIARERAVDDARRLTRSLMAGTVSGPLAGVPIAHKDLFATAGLRTTGGSRLYEHWVPERDATVVARLAAAGTVLLGKTNTHELGGGVTTINPFFGTTRNPRDHSRIPGGSSGGSAVAVVARLCAGATGSDTGGSVRIPAALCGCVGLKPTYGLVSAAGVLGASPTFDHAGLLARTVEDVALLLDAVAGHDPDDVRTVQRSPGEWRRGLLAARRAAGAARDGALRGVRIGVPRAFFFDGLAPEVARGVGRALAALRAAGADVQDVDLAPGADRAIAAARGAARAGAAAPRAGAGPFDTLFEVMFGPIIGAEVQAKYGEDFRTRPGMFSRGFAASFGEPAADAATLARAHEARRTFEAEIDGVLARVDVLVTPTVPVLAPPIDGPIDGWQILRNTWPFNAARTPALSLPCPGGDPALLPAGLQIVGRAFGEAMVLRVAGVVESAA